MKKLLFVLLFQITFVPILAQETNISAFYNAPTPEQDSVHSGLIALRGANFHEDLLGDGVSAVLVANYVYHTVSVFAVVGNDSLELKWTSRIELEPAGYSSSTPRFVTSGDLDNDGLNEIIFQVDPIGIVIYEWDGVADSWNFGTMPSYQYDFGTSGTGAFYSEYFEVTDVDGDDVDELLMATNASGADSDNYYIFSGSGNWQTDSPAFSSLFLEAEFSRDGLADWGGGGSPYALHAANLDGVGNSEIILHNWNNKNVTPITVPAKDTYELAIKDNGKQNLLLSTSDDVALFAGVVTDIDSDGREEVYLPTYNSGSKGFLHMIHYEDGQNTNEIDSTNAMLIDMSSVSAANQFGIGFGDLDANGKTNLYVAGGLGHNVTSAEFQGGDKTDINNWIFSIIYENESDMYSAITYKDSVGILDTIHTPDYGFVSKLFAKNTDIDKDGKQDLILPYQGVVDSIEVINLTWNSGKYDSVVTKVLNPKKWGLRILESSVGTGVEAKELTIITPNDYTLNQNYPNPFNPTTNIRFSLPVSKKISVIIYDMLGSKVKTLVNNENFSKGSYEVTWNGTNNFGSKVASGNYIATMKFGNFNKSIKMQLLK
ncbi:MAG: T9SS type A sorting domain-containing protein [Melioribacteraceae bacterium]|nr:T9SS type A sorting domain-containing protein [Melioribacteraceae bacterium]